MLGTGSSEKIEKKAKYRSTQNFITDNPLVREGVSFELKVENNPIPDGLYEFRSPGTFINVRTGRTHGVEGVLARGRNELTIRFVPNIEAMSLKRIANSTGRTSLSYMTRGVKTKWISQDLNAVETAELHNASVNGSNEARKLLRGIQYDNLHSTSRSSFSLDFESFVTARSEGVAKENIFSAGLTETTETTYAMKGGGLFSDKSKALKKVTNKSLHLFDIDKMLSYVKGDLKEDPIKGFGKKNLALMYNHLHNFIEGNTEGFTPRHTKSLKSRSDYISNIAGTPEGDKLIIRNPENLNSARFVEDYIRNFEGTYGKSNLIKILENIKTSVENNKLSRLKKLGEQRAHMAYGEYSLGVLEHTLSSERNNQTVREEFRFVSNIVTATQENVRRFGAKEVLTYSRAESDVFASNIDELKKKLEIEERTSKDSAKAQSLRQAITRATEFQEKIIDYKARAESVFDRLLPDIKKNLQESHVGVVNSLKQYGIPMDVLEKSFGESMTSFIDSKGKGASLELLHQVFSQNFSKEFHTGTFDSSDLNNFNLWLEDLLRNGQEYKSNTTKKLGQGLVSVSESPYAVYDVSTNLARRIQNRIVSSAVAKNLSDNDLANVLRKNLDSSGLVEFDNLFGSTKLEKTDDSLKDFKFASKSNRLQAEQMFEKMNYSNMGKKFNELNSQFSEERKRLAMKSIDNPGLLAKSLTLPPMAKVAAMGAFLWLTQKESIEKPDSSIETGEHNSMETLARRIATTPFGSPVGKFIQNMSSVMASTFKGAYRGLDDYIARSSRKIDTAISEKIVKINKTALGPAVQSAERVRLSKIDNMFDEVKGIHKVNNRTVDLIADRMHKQLKFSNSTEVLRDSLALERKESWKFLKDSLGDMPSYKSRDVSWRKGFFLGSTPPSTKAQINYLGFSAKQRQIHVYPEQVFKYKVSDNMLDNLALNKMYIGKGNFVRPNFSIYWDRSSSAFSRSSFKGEVFESIDKRKSAYLPYNQQITFEKALFDKEASDLSSAFAGRRQIKDTLTRVTIRNDKSAIAIKGNYSYTDYPNTLLKQNPEQNTYASIVSSIESSNSRKRIGEVTRIYDKSKGISSGPVLYEGRGKVPQYVTPVAHNTNEVSRAQIPVVRQPKRLDPNDYINDASNALQSSFYGLTKGNYPPSTSSVMRGQLEQAYRY